MVIQESRLELIFLSDTYSTLQTFPASASLAVPVLFSFSFLGTVSHPSMVANLTLSSWLKCTMLPLLPHDLMRTEIGHPLARWTVAWNTSQWCKQPLNRGSLVILRLTSRGLPDIFQNERRRFGARSYASTVSIALVSFLAFVRADPAVAGFGSCLNK